MVLKVSPDVVDIRVFCCLFVVCTNVASKHTLPRLARSTLNELQQNQHEKASLVCVRVQNPWGLALVPCALSMVDLSGQLRCWITHTITQTHKHTWCRRMLCFLAPYARTTRYEEAFFSSENQGKKGSLRSRASLKSSCWPWWHPGESPTYIFNEEYI